jgi:hypothetical protein
MAERVHGSRSRALAGVAVTALSAVLAACSSGPGGDEDVACRAPRAAPPAETALLPAELSFEEIGTVTDVRKPEGLLMVHAVTTKPIDEVTVLIQDAVTAAGYRPAGMDNEGFEAEVFFTSGPYAAGQARVRRGDCRRPPPAAGLMSPSPARLPDAPDGAKARWDIDLVLIDLDAVPSPTAVPTATPDPSGHLPRG